MPSNVKKGGTWARLGTSLQQITEVNMYSLRHALCALLMLQASVCFAGSCSNGVQTNGKETIEFSGILHHQVHWGPPNFGEHPRTDSKFTAWIVSVGKPVPVQAGVQFAGKSQASVSEIQLSIDPTTFHSKVLRPLDGKMVVATGKFWQASTPGDVTPVVLSVETLAATDKTICRVTPDD